MCDAASACTASHLLERLSVRAINGFGKQPFGRRRSVKIEPSGNSEIELHTRARAARSFKRDKFIYAGRRRDGQGRMGAGESAARNHDDDYLPCDDGNAINVIVMTAITTRRGPVASASSARDVRPKRRVLPCARPRPPAPRVALYTSRDGWAHSR